MASRPPQPTLPMVGESMSHSVPATILIVDDEILVRLLFVDHLEADGYRVLAANDGDEALGILRANDAVDLLVTDIRMPGHIDGIALAQYAKREFGLPVIIVSGHHQQPVSNGIADALLEKPCQLDQLSAVIEQALK
jgi:DNA-binding NtrC family response regulator